jgi:hypothetical protein
MAELVTPRQVLDLELPENDSGASTVRGYLIALLDKLWREDDRFSGKHPFGNSQWQYDLYEPMGRAGMVAMAFDADGYVETFSHAEQVRADSLILAAIQELGSSR